MKSKTHRRNPFRSALLGGFLLALAFPAFLTAQNKGVNVRLIPSVESINPEKRYAVLSRERQDPLCFLTDDYKKGKAGGKATEETSPPSSLNAEEDCLWDITLDGDRLTLSRNGKYITYVGIGTNVEPSPSITDYAKWKLTESGDGGFVLFNVKINERMLCASNSGDDYRFGCYTKASYPNGTVYLYEAEGATPPSGNAVRPNEGARVALYCDIQAKGATGTISTQPLLLTNGTLAPSEGLEIWTARDSNEDSFYLEDTDGGYLDYNLNSSPTKSPWKVENGLITTHETPQRYLRFAYAEKKWLVTEDPSQGKAVLFAPVADDPERHVSPDGVVKLTGGWDAEALADLSLDNATCLDLTALSLPASPESFTTSLEERNLPIFVNETEKTTVPANWRFAVSCGKTNALINPVMLKDGSPFYTDRPIKVGEGEMTYQRTVNVETSPWQTLCLPFSTTLDEDSPLFRYDGVEGNRILLNATNVLLADTPCLFYALQSPVRFTSDECTIQGCAGQAVDAVGLFGTYRRLIVKDESEGIYLLAPAPQDFVLAKGGSGLNPFRAYLSLKGKSLSTLKIGSSRPQ